MANPRKPVGGNKLPTPGPIKPSQASNLAAARAARAYLEGNGVDVKAIMAKRPLTFTDIIDMARQKGWDGADGAAPQPAGRAPATEPDAPRGGPGDLGDAPSLEDLANMPVEGDIPGEPAAAPDKSKPAAGKRLTKKQNETAFAALVTSGRSKEELTKLSPQQRWTMYQELLEQAKSGDDIAQTNVPADKSQRAPTAEADDLDEPPAEPIRANKKGGKGGKKKEPKYTPREDDVDIDSAAEKAAAGRGDGKEPPAYKPGGWRDPDNFLGTGAKRPRPVQMVQDYWPSMVAYGGLGAATLKGIHSYFGKKPEEQQQSRAPLGPVADRGYIDAYMGRRQPPAAMPPTPPPIPDPLREALGPDTFDPRGGDFNALLPLSPYPPDKPTNPEDNIRSMRPKRNDT